MNFGAGGDQAIQRTAKHGRNWWKILTEQPSLAQSWRLRPIDPWTFQPKKCLLTVKKTNGGEVLVNVQQHKKLTDDIWEIAKRLRGPYRPPQSGESHLELSGRSQPRF